MRDRLGRRGGCTMLIGSLFLVLALLGISAARSAETPLPPGSLNDLDKTPGATNPDITQDNINETICNRGHWTTKSIRPPTSYTNKLKKQQIIEYGFKDKKTKDYEEDHLISLTIGGHPRDPKNLWPERYSGKWGARIKDKLENRLNKLICNGTLTLKEAQDCIAKNWVKCYKEMMTESK